MHECQDTAPQGHRYGPMTPCENNHTIHRDGLRFWLTCGDESLATATFTESSIDYQEEPRHWSSRVMLLHEIDCWKAENGRLRSLLAGCRDWFDNPDGEPSSSDLLDRINEALG